MFRVDIAIPTHNRADELALTLSGLLKLRTPIDVEWRIVVVNNASTDDTEIVLDRFQKEFQDRLKRLYEERPGLCHARNAAVRSSEADVVAFLDDDVDVEPQWLEAITKAFDEENCDVVGGRAELRYPIARPEWLGPTEEIHLSRVDLGANRKKCGPDEIFGLNMSIKRHWFDTIGLFRTDLDRVGQCLLSGGETELLRRIDKAGAKFVYEPTALLWHRVPFSRLTQNWFLSRQYWGARGGKRAAQMSASTAMGQLISSSILLSRSLASLTWRGMTHGWSSIEAYQRRRWIADARGEIDESIHTLLSGRTNEGKSAL